MMVEDKHRGIWVGSLSEYPILGEDLCCEVAYTSEFSAEIVGTDGWFLLLCAQNGMLLTMTALQEHAPTPELN